MASFEVEHIVKTFGSQRAVDDVTFAVEPGEIFGLLGPNGAGKTTTIRIALDIFKPDSGRVAVLGGPMSEDKKNRIGYLPEERGLYQDIRLEQCILYLATLKGLDRHTAQTRMDAYLEQFDLVAHRRKKLKELSKGMQQKAQLIVTLIHEPELLIVDEPFSALDPVNTQMIKDVLREQRRKGTTIVMCTHQMNQVEELCDRLVLINRGRVMLYGALDEIRRQYRSHTVLVRSLNGLPDGLVGVERVEPINGSVALHLRPDASPQAVLQELVQRSVQLEQFEVALPTLDEIFIEVVTGKETTA